MKRRCPKCGNTDIVSERRRYIGGSSGHLECTKCGNVDHPGVFDMQEQLDELFITELKAELELARKKFPSANLSMIALTEEVGELAQAVLKVAAGKWDRTRLREEAVQVAAMAMRVANDRDESVAATVYVEPGA